MNKIQHKAAKGFTLIELMIVVAIIGILAAIAIPKFADLVTRSKESSVKGSLGSIRSAISIYYSDTEGVFPPTLAGLTENGKYLREIPRVAIPTTSVANGVPSDTNHDSDNGVSNVSPGAGVSYTGTVAESDTERWRYVTNGNDAGTLVVNCSHSDTKILRWTSY